MGTRQKVGRTVLLVTALTANLVAIAILACRPTRIYSEWLELGFADTALIRRLGAWAGGREAPWTPIGLLSVVEPTDLVVMTALLFVLSVLVILLAMTWEARSLPWLAKVRTRVSWPPPISLRVRAAMFLVALVGIELGWEINGWETWRLREAHLKRLNQLIELQASNRKSIQSLSEIIHQGDSYLWPEPVEILTQEAIAAERAARRDSWKRALADSKARADLYPGLIRKYEYAAAHPRVRLEPEPDRPATSVDPGPEYWLATKAFRKALDANEKELGRYPGLWRRHNQRAWILATCPDPQIRDGDAAVRSATRACELTSWKAADALETLAAAQAEAGDFKAAVVWQTKALELNGVHTAVREHSRDRLALYKAGMPYHEKN